MSPTLRRRLLALVLLALAWAWAVPGMHQPGVQGLAHELVHLQVLSHHHHDDGELHLDDLAPAEQAHHHASDSAKPLASSAPAPGGPAALPHHRLVSHDGPHSLAVVLEGPLRPPRSPRV